VGGKTDAGPDLVVELAVLLDLVKVLPLLLFGTDSALSRYPMLAAWASVNIRQATRFGGGEGHLRCPCRTGRRTSIKADRIGPPRSFVRRSRFGLRLPRVALVCAQLPLSPAAGPTLVSLPALDVLHCFQSRSLYSVPTFSTVLPAYSSLPPHLPQLLGRIGSNPPTSSCCSQHVMVLSGIPGPLASDVCPTVSTVSTASFQ